MAVPPKQEQVESVDLKVGAKLLEAMARWVLYACAESERCAHSQNPTSRREVVDAEPHQHGLL